MNERKLTAEQVRVLSAYERYFQQATTAAWCSYPGQAGINTMLDIWASLTGRPYAYKPGCPNCLLNLVRDMGHIYFAQRDEVLDAEAAAKAEETAVEQANEPKPSKAPAKKQNARKRK